MIVNRDRTGEKGCLRLSVIIPTYNCEAYLDECLASVLSQLPEDCELIAADDGSTDGTAQLLAGYEGRRENLRILYCPHRGASGARNAGLDAAAGEYVAFLDCDDCLRAGFFAESLPLLAQGADLYIFGIERVPLAGDPEAWTVEDRVFPDASAFADAYVRTRRMLIYSNCNKFYRRRLIEAQGLRFAEDVSFGEDRLFNYRFLQGCGSIVTSGILMLRYLQRSLDSLSSRHIPDYFTRALALHRAKVESFLSLSRGTTGEERRSFAARDLAAEIRGTVSRFGEHPEEAAENMGAVNALIFSLLPGLEQLLREQGAVPPEEWYASEAARELVLKELISVSLPYACQDSR